jgi:hypothetical protein
MLSLFAKLVSISILFLISTCLHSEPYSNSQAQIVGDDGQLIAANLSMLLPSDTDKAICSALKDPSKLPYISYGDSNGFNACISRCLTYIVRQICPQLPAGKNYLAMKPELFEKLLTTCNADINRFVTSATQCPYVKCKPY